MKLNSLYGYDDIYIGTTGADYIDWLWTNRKISPIGTFGASSIPPAKGSYNCVVQTGANSFKFNINNESAYGVSPQANACNAMVAIDY